MEAKTFWFVKKISEMRQTKIKVENCPYCGEPLGSSGHCPVCGRQKYVTCPCCGGSGVELYMDENYHIISEYDYNMEYRYNKKKKAFRESCSVCNGRGKVLESEFGDLEVSK